MSHAIAQTYIAVHEYKAKITAFLLILCAALALYYGFTVYSMVSKTVALDGLKSKTAELSGAVGKLDTAYLELSRSVTPDKLASHGLTTGKVSAFIPVSNTLGRVALSINEL